MGNIKCFNPSSEEKAISIKTRFYHYTSPEGLYSILEKASIRFTDCQFLNDKSEYTHVKVPLEKALKELKMDLHNEFEDIIEIMISNDFETTDVTVDHKDKNFIFNFTSKRYFVFCASTAHDSLTMWNYYIKGGNYQGYCIGLNTKTLLDCFSAIDNLDVEIFYGKVLYKEKEKIDFLKNLLLKTDQELEDKLRNATTQKDINISSQEIKGDFLSYIENYRLFFKDEAFANEKEYRFIIKLPTDYQANENDQIKIGYGLNRGIITPYCELSINKDNTIDSIMLSPMLEWELSRQGLKRFIKHNKYNANISIDQSKVPIRF